MTKFLRRTLNSSNSPGLPFIPGIELIPEPLSIFKPRFFTWFPFPKAVRQDVESPTDLNTFPH